MKRRFFAHVPLILVLLLAALAAYSVPARAMESWSSSQNRTSPTCTSAIDGVKFAQVVPEYLSWTLVLDALAGNGEQQLLGSIPAAAPTHLTIIRERLNRFQSQKARVNVAQFTSEPRLREAAIAEAVLETRDDLLRTLPQELFAELERASKKAAARVFSLPAPSRMTQTEDGQTACRVAIKGHEHPHLIREGLYWQFYFYSRAVTAEDYRLAPGVYTSAHISSVSRTLPVASDHIGHILEVATRVHAEIKALPESPQSDEEAERIALRAREQLLRTLPTTVWNAVKAEAHRVRRGMVMGFPSTPAER